MRELVCQCCDLPKDRLDSIESKLIKGFNVIMCKTCIDSKFEPRHVIILAVHQYGITDDIKKVIRDHRYVGQSIPAIDIV